MPITETQTWDEVFALLCPRPSRRRQPNASLLKLINELRRPTIPYALYPEVGVNHTLNLYDEWMYDETFHVRRLSVRAVRKPGEHIVLYTYHVWGQRTEQREWLAAGEADLCEFVLRRLEEVGWKRRK